MAESKGFGSVHDAIKAFVADSGHEVFTLFVCDDRSS